MNVVCLSGHLGADPRVLDTVVILKMATNRRIKIDGEWQSRPEWHSLTVAGKRRGWASCFRKGDQLSVTGSIHYDHRDPTANYPKGARHASIWVSEIDGKPSGHNLLSDKVPDGWQNDPLADAK